MYTLKLADYPDENTKIDAKGRGAGYGLDAELSQKLADKYDHELEGQARAWIEAVTGKSFGDKSFGEALKDGLILCETINAIRPGTIKKVNKMKAPFMMMENICHFLKGCRVLGVNSRDCFETVDLFEEKDLGLVVDCIHALGRAVQRSCPEWGGPILGKKEAERNQRHFTPEQIKAGKDTMTLLGCGSKGIMDRTQVSKAGITFGADNAKAENASAGANVVPILGMGSKGIMERSEVKKAGITFGADNAGAAQESNSIPQLSMGSKGIMERKQITKPGVTFGADATSNQVSEQKP